MDFIPLEKPLLVAVEANSLESVQFLLLQNPYFDPRVFNSKGRNVLQIAVQAKNYEILGLLLEKCNNLQFFEEDPQCSATMQAAKINDLEATKMICSRLADSEVSLKLRGIQAALTEAAKRLNFLVGKYLVDVGVELNQTVLEGHSPLSACCKYSHNELFLEIIKNSCCNVNLLCKNRKTALYYACKFGTENYIRLLIKRGADPGIASISQKKTALYVALERGNEEVIRSLLPGANIESFRRMTTFGVNSWTLARLKYRDRKILKEIRQVREHLDEQDYIRRAAPYHPGIPDDLLKVERKIASRKKPSYPYSFEMLKKVVKRRRSVDLGALMFRAVPINSNRIFEEEKCKLQKLIGNIFEYSGNNLGYQQISVLPEKEIFPLIKHSIILNQRRLIETTAKLHALGNVYVGKPGQNPKLRFVDNSDIRHYSSKNIKKISCSQSWNDAVLKKQISLLKNRADEMKISKPEGMNEKALKGIIKEIQDTIQTLKTLSTLRIEDLLCYEMMFPLIKPHLIKILSSPDIGLPTTSIPRTKLYRQMSALPLSNPNSSQNAQVKHEEKVFAQSPVLNRSRSPLKASIFLQEKRTESVSSKIRTKKSSPKRPSSLQVSFSDDKIKKTNSRQDEPIIQVQINKKRKLKRIRGRPASNNRKPTIDINSQESLKSSNPITMQIKSRKGRGIFWGQKPIFVAFS